MPRGRQRQQNTAEDRMWRSMRFFRRFAIADIAMTAETTTPRTANYVLALVRGGYLHRDTGASRGKHASYALIKNTGPIGPRMKLDGLWDPNVPPADSPRKIRHVKSIREVVEEGDADAKRGMDRET